MVIFTRHTAYLLLHKMRLKWNSLVKDRPRVLCSQKTLLDHLDTKFPVCVREGSIISRVLSVSHTYTHTHTHSLHSIASMGDGWENHSGGQERCLLSKGILLLLNHYCTKLSQFCAGKLSALNHDSPGPLREDQRPRTGYWQELFCHLLLKCCCSL